jgi:hypothetical protein
MRFVKFADIPQFPRAHYQVSVGWQHLEAQLEELGAGAILELDPDFQRAHVWTRGQQVAYVEYILRGGEVAKDIVFNAPEWPSTRGDQKIVLVDGKQRLEAVRAFLRDEVEAFGTKYSEFEGPLRSTTARLNFRFCSLSSREELLELYLNINAGGTPHTSEELHRVQEMLEQERGS